MQDGRPVDIPIREGDFFLLPAHVHHSPQRFANTVGLVIERRRLPGERDGLLWYCEKCRHPLYSEYFELTNIETELPPVFERFYASLEHRTCRHCGTVLEPPPKTAGKH
jgi:3-hydroxyanthranilate 3,4-dioxygenase